MHQYFHLAGPTLLLYLGDNIPESSSVKSRVAALIRSFGRGGGGEVKMSSLGIMTCRLCLHILLRDTKS